MRKRYPSDVTPEQFEVIRPLLESARKKTAPRRVCLYEVFCAVLYLLRTGCQWRALPSDFPKWRTVHSYFAIWSEPRENGSLLGVKEPTLRTSACLTHFGHALEGCWIKRARV